MPYLYTCQSESSIKVSPPSESLGQPVDGAGFTLTDALHIKTCMIV